VGVSDDDKTNDELDMDGAIAEVLRQVELDRGNEPMGTVARYVRTRNKIGRAITAYEGGQTVAVTDLTSDVPCNGCTACCRSGLRVVLSLRESGEGLETELVDGRRGLKQNADGSCVHLVDGKCSVYEHRPIACRSFDCRDYAVASVRPGNFPAIAEAAMRWRPEIKSNEDRTTLERVGTVAVHLALKKQLLTGKASKLAMALSALPSEEARKRLAQMLEMSDDWWATR
jgi:hypothetical protein